MYSYSNAAPWLATHTLEYPTRRGGGEGEKKERDREREGKGRRQTEMGGGEGESIEMGNIDF